MRTTLVARGLLWIVALSPVHARAQAIGSPQLAPMDLGKLSIEQLMDIEVTSVSRSEETAGDAPAALVVVTSSDIARTGATTVPEALRRVPGIHAAQVTSSAWALSSRGFSSVNSEKLLVLSDSRSIYTPLFSGVLWDAQDYLLHDIERIEVIRGPGATLWGANAVNGVISITTKSARDTQGLYVDVLGGSEERGAVSARYGGRLSDRAYYRVFGKYIDRDATFNATTPRRDDWRMGHLGFRADWEPDDRDTVTVQGDLYQGNVGQFSPSISIAGRTGPAGDLRIKTGGGNILARWRRRTAGGSDIQVRAYYDRTRRDDPSFVDELDTVDIDLQHRMAPAARHELTWGASYRVTANRNEGKGIFNLVPVSSRDYLVSGFVQDRVRLAAPLDLTVGTKLGHNDFSGTEIQPSARLSWNVSSGQTAWAAVSRAVRVPTRLERDIAIDVTNPSANPIVRLLGNPDQDAEQLNAYEAGYRWKVFSSMLVDVATFHNRYRRLTSLEPSEPYVDSGDSRTIVPIVTRNLTSGHASGLELLATIDPAPRWRLTMSSSTVKLNLAAAGQDLNGGRFAGEATPRHQLGLHSAIDLAERIHLDVMLRHLTGIRNFVGSVAGDRLPGYAEMDVRAAWRQSPRVELSIVGQNLLHRRHAEFGGPAARGEIERGVYAKLAVGL